MIIVRMLVVGFPKGCSFGIVSRSLFTGRFIVMMGVVMVTIFVVVMMVARV